MSTPGSLPCPFKAGLESPRIGGPVEFSLLGPLQVVDGDRMVELGGRKQRAILAMLVLEQNRVVSMDRVIDRLWGDDSPAQATGTVQAYVSSLRKALGPVRRPGGPARVLISKAP